MLKKLSRHGNSMALVIDRGIMDLLDIKKNTALDISTDGNVLIVAPLREPERRKKFQKALAEVHVRYGNTLKRLAD